MERQLMSVKGTKMKSEAETFELAVSGHLMEEGNGKPEESEDGSTFHAHFKQAETEYKKQIIFEFQAKEGKGGELNRKITEYKEACYQLMVDSAGPDEAEEMKENVHISNKDDQVTVHVNMPPEEEDKAEDFKESIEAMEEEGSGLPMPTFDAKFSTGRSVVDIFHKMKDHDESAVSVLGGVSMTLSTNIPGKLITGLAKMMGLDRHNMEYLEAIAALSSVHESFSLKYNKEGLNEALADERGLPLPWQTRLGLERTMKYTPWILKKPLHGLQDVSDGIKSVVMRGLPENLEVIVELTNVKVGPILRTLIGDLPVEEEKN